MSGRQQKGPIVFTNMRGRDGSTTASIAIPPYKALEYRNTDLYKVAFARKRGGSIAVTISSANLTGVTSSAIRHVPGADDAAAELWLVCSDGVVARNAAGSWTNPTLKDAISARPQDVIGIPFNGKLYLLYDSAQDRVPVWDPTTGSVRRAGLATPAAPSVANTGAGSYAATARYYRVCYTEQRGGSTYRRSLASSAQSFTPSGSGTAARVTKPAALSEGETHWELYGSADEDGPFYLIATTVVGTTTYDDSAAPSGYSGGAAMPTQGENTPLHSAKFGITDDNRLLLSGAYETGHSSDEVWFTPVLGSTSAVFFDDERLPSANKVSFNEKDSGTMRGFGGPLDSVVLVFKSNSTWRLIPTGIESDPYRKKNISKTVGLIHQKTVVMAEDETGTPTAYWLSQHGPYRYNLKTGLAKLVWDIEDIWDTVNLDASTVVAHGLHHPQKHQVWWWVSTSGANSPNLKLVYDTKLGRIVESGVVQDGWTIHDGQSASARCSVMFSTTIGATMSRDMKPYIGQSGGNARFWRCDTTDGTDNGTAFRGYVTLPDRHPAGLAHKATLASPAVLGSEGSHSIAISQTRNYGEEERSGTVAMSADGSETRVLRVIEGVETADAYAVSLEVGDEIAVDSGQWELDAVFQPYEVRESMVQG
jgi:hypothetical protein